MKQPVRFVLLLCALVLVLGAVAHARVFPRAAAALARTDLPAQFANDFKALWLIDSATLLIAAALFTTIALRPAAASRPVGVLIAAIPAATAILIYIFVGSFYAAHLLLATAIAAAVAVMTGSASGAPRRGR